MNNNIVLRLCMVEYWYPFGLRYYTMCLSQLSQSWGTGSKKNLIAQLVSQLSLSEKYGSGSRRTMGTSQVLLYISISILYITDIHILVIWLVELTSRDIHYYSHPHRRSKSPIRPWGIVFPIQQLGSSLFPTFFSSRPPLLKQRSTCAKGCDPIYINLCDFK